MEKHYFTYGNSDKFPYQNTHLIVVASSYDNATKGFKEKHPDINPDCMNCSDCYGEKEWVRDGKVYADRSPAEIIWTETCYGKKPDGYGELYVFVPSENEIIRITEGSGDNLLKEDIDNGYVDYIYYEQYGLDCGISETDGGDVLLKELFRNKYKCTANCIAEVLDMTYGSSLINCMILA